MTLKLYNSLTHQKETFTPIQNDHIKMYACGPTVYDRAHIGNARPAVIFDVLYRYLMAIYPQVTYVRNITDVDDKINTASKNLGISIQELTQQTTAAYHEGMKALGTLPPTYEPKATDHIEQMISMIKDLISKNYAYESQSHVLFQVNKFSEYGKLSRRNKDELLAGARIEVAPYKKDPGDFVLWKPSSDDLPGWDSPWGKGRPGWHIECSAMSYEYLGKIFDIHAGGIDLIFPHHENEVAQSRCVHETEVMANYWLHNGHLTVDGEKMSKSLGNFFTVQDLLNTYSGEVIRLGLLMTHYRQPLDWSSGVLQRAKQILDRWYTAIKEVSSTTTLPNIPSSLLNALEDDLNTPLAISYIHQFVNDFNKAENEREKEKLASQIKSAANLMGLLQSSSQDWLQGGILDIEPAQIDQLVNARKQARENKDFAESDRIRNFLESKGIQLEDTTQGTTWRRI